MFTVPVASEWVKRRRGDRLGWKKGSNETSYLGRDETTVGPITAKYGRRFAEPVYVYRNRTTSMCRAFGRCDGLHNCTEKCRGRKLNYSAKEFFCSTCGAEYEVKGRFELHVSTCGEKKHKCPDCPAAFKQKSDLVRHVRTHTREKPFKCGECPRTFAQPCGLSVHLRSHGDGAVSHRCHLCNLTYKFPSSLARHVRHTHEQPEPEQERRSRSRSKT
jgi:uncharacterized Zn-finger protein